jgi:hypothetical protein
MVGETFALTIYYFFYHILAQCGRQLAPRHTVTLPPMSLYLACPGVALDALDGGSSHLDNHPAELSVVIRCVGMGPKPSKLHTAPVLMRDRVQCISTTASYQQCPASIQPVPC